MVTVSKSCERKCLFSVALWVSVRRVPFLRRSDGPDSIRGVARHTAHRSQSHGSCLFIGLWMRYSLVLQILGFRLINS